MNILFEWGGIKCQLRSLIGGRRKPRRLLCFMFFFNVCPQEAIALFGSGKLSSTNYPKSNYAAFRNCTWNITAPAHKFVRFVFTFFVLSSCPRNYCSDSCSMYSFMMVVRRALLQWGDFVRGRLG